MMPQWSLCACTELVIYRLFANRLESILLTAPPSVYSLNAPPVEVISAGRSIAMCPADVNNGRDTTKCPQLFPHRRIQLAWPDRPAWRG